MHPTNHLHASRDTVRDTSRVMSSPASRDRDTHTRGVSRVPLAGLNDERKPSSGHVVGDRPQ